MENDKNTKWLPSVWKSVYIDKKGKPILTEYTNMFESHKQGL